MSEKYIKKLSNGKFRVQIRKSGYPNFDKCYETLTAATAARDKALGGHKPVSGKESLSELWEKYLASSQFNSKEERTQKTERQRMTSVVLPYFGGYSLKALESDTSKIYDYIDERMATISKRTKKRLSGATVRLEVAALSALVEFAKLRNMVRENFVTGISRPTSKPRKRRVKSQEAGALYLHARVTNRRVAKASRFNLLLRHLGCRPSELAELLAANVDFQKREVLFVDTKNGTDRLVHATTPALELLRLQFAELEDGCPYLFATKSRKGDWVPYNYAWGVSLLRKAEIVGKDFHSHAGRREFISDAIENNISYATIRKQTGHKSSAAVEIYDQGLSTAPEIRKTLDALADKAKDIQLLGVITELGITPEMLAQVMGKKDESNIDVWDDGIISHPK
ncbi:tyrosine-type recombinase/integrase [Herbaspirillum seropedicae]|uniref:tyrosine-type recombinase/integrase n=1 Tax=Herbaspirillum seropedicae TaxID=964 RepID=UPI003F8D7457